nr:gustatory receptor 36 [Papilio polytes]
MKILKSLRFLFIIGNVLLTFRNLSFISRRKRYFIYIVILFDILLSIINIIVCIHFKIYYRIADVLFVNFLLFNSMVFIILSCYHAEKFKDMLKFLESNNNFIDEDNIYLKNFGRKKIMLKVAMITYLAIKLIFPIFYSRHKSLTISLPYFVYVVLKLNSMWWDFRFVFEYMLISALLYVFSEQLECIIRSVVKHKRFVAVNFQLSNTNLDNEFVCNQYVEKISEWFQALTNLTEAIKLFNTIFGLQLAVMLITGTFYVSLFLYDIAAFSVKHNYGNIIIVSYAIRLVITLLVVLVLSRAGQRLHNNVKHLRRRIGKIYILSLVDEKFYTATKDILEYISCDQMRIQAFGSIEVDMRLPPTFIMLFTSYTILALQFNNVL